VKTSTKFSDREGGRGRQPGGVDGVERPRPPRARGPRLWWDYVILIVLAALLLRPLEALTGDVSRYLPYGAFSASALGKDQIIYASAASTVLLPSMIAAAIVCSIRWVRRVGLKRVSGR
jgi:hypothetical protein